VSPLFRTVFFTNIHSSTTLFSRTELGILRPHISVRNL
jgi:hypothetical protein